MTCEVTQVNGSTVIMCSRGARRKRCHDCGRLGATLQCDGPVAVNKTCDRHICGSCATTDGPDRDYCRDCARDWPGRQA